MKHMDFFCASPASTSIAHHHTRPINHRHGSDTKKILSNTPCISQLPFDPNPFSNYQKSRKSSAKNSEMRRKSSANIDDVAGRSSRYLLSDSPFFEKLSDSDTAKALVPSGKMKPPSLGSGSYVKALSLKPSSTRLYSEQKSSNNSLSSKSLSTRARSCHQVVELRVSIHCKGCEGKVRKHIARMEGVTSFSIDRESKKVTIIGDVTPLEVLTSISRVKNAQFWPSTTSSSLSSSTPSLAIISTE